MDGKKYYQILALTKIDRSLKTWQAKVPLLKMAKSVLITGCSEGGIGDTLAREFHSKGARVFATARTLSKTKHLKAMGVETLSLDVTSTESIETALATISGATGGKLDILVNNSGTGKRVRRLRALILTRRFF